MKTQEPNQRASLDAAVAFSLVSGRHWRRASEPERYAEVKPYWSLRCPVCMTDL